jgi:hypothetical protein
MRLVSYKTYREFAKKYKIKLSKKGIKKTFDELSQEIYNYEVKNNVTKGLYFY